MPSSSKEGKQEIPVSAPVSVPVSVSVPPQKSKKYLQPKKMTKMERNIFAKEAIYLSELLPEPFPFFHEIQNIVNIRTSERIYRLCIITYHTNVFELRRKCLHY